MNLEELLELSEDELDQALYVARAALNDGQRHFSNHVLLGTNSSEAAREAGYAEKAIHSAASRLLRNVKVSLVLDLAREQQRRVHNLDMNWSKRKLKELLAAAQKADDLNAAVNCVKELNKLQDLYPDVKSTVEVVGTVDFTTLPDDYWGALLAYKHELVEPPATH